MNFAWIGRRKSIHTLRIFRLPLTELPDFWANFDAWQTSKHAMQRRYQLWAYLRKLVSTYRGDIDICVGAWHVYTLSSLHVEIREGKVSDWPYKTGYGAVYPSNF